MRGRKRSASASKGPKRSPSIAQILPPATCRNVVEIEDLSEEQLRKYMTNKAHVLLVEADGKSGDCYDLGYFQQVLEDPTAIVYPCAPHQQALMSEPYAKIGLQNETVYVPADHLLTMVREATSEINTRIWQIVRTKRKLVRSISHNALVGESHVSAFHCQEGSDLKNVALLIPWTERVDPSSRSKYEIVHNSLQWIAQPEDEIRQIERLEKLWEQYARKRSREQKRAIKEAKQELWKKKFPILEVERLLAPAVRVEDNRAKDYQYINRARRHSDATLFNKLVGEHKLRAKDIPAFLPESKKPLNKAFMLEVLTWVFQHLHVTYPEYYEKIAPEQLVRCVVENECDAVTRADLDDDFPMLQFAASRNNVEVFRSLRDRGLLTKADISLDVLYEAAENGAIDVLKFLKKHKYVSAKDIKGADYMVLDGAVRGGHLNVLKYLIGTFRLSPKDIRNVKLAVPAAASAQSGLDILQYLHKKGHYTPDDARSDHNAAFYNAVESGRVDMVRWLHDTFGLTREDIRSMLISPVVRAASLGFREILKYLHDAFHLDHSDATHHNNLALMNAVSAGDLRTVRYLHDAFHLTSDDARTNDNQALITAAENGDLAMLTYLKNAFDLTRADARARHDKALNMAISKKNNEVLRRLQELWELVPANVGSFYVVPEEEQDEETREDATAAEEQEEKEEKEGKEGEQEEGEQEEGEQEEGEEEEGERSGDRREREEERQEERGEGEEEREVREEQAGVRRAGGSDSPTY